MGTPAGKTESFVHNTQPLASAEVVDELVMTDEQLKQSHSDMIRAITAFSAILRTKNPSSTLAVKVDQLTVIASTLTVDEMREVSENIEEMDEVLQKIEDEREEEK